MENFTNLENENFATCMKSAGCMSIFSFYLPNDNLNWKLLHFLHPDVLSKLCLTTEQICLFADYLNWEILSDKFLPCKILVKFEDKINWNIYLSNGYSSKSIQTLKTIKNVLIKYKQLFLTDVSIKQKYYSDEFIQEFPNIVDFIWCVKNIKLSSKTLIKYWDEFTPLLICKHQKLKKSLIEKKKYQIDWNTLLRSAKLIERQKDSIIQIGINLIDWKQISMKKKLSQYTISKYLDYFDLELIVKYQELNECFIISHMKILNMNLVSLYQNLSYDFIKTYYNKLKPENLLKNINLPNLKVIKINNTILIIDFNSLQNQSVLFV